MAFPEGSLIAQAHLEGVKASLNPNMPLTPGILARLPDRNMVIKAGRTGYGDPATGEVHHWLDLFEKEGSQFGIISLRAPQKRLDPIGYLSSDGLGKTTYTVPDLFVEPKTFYHSVVQTEERVGEFFGGNIVFRSHLLE